MYFFRNLVIRSDSEESTKIALVKKYIEFKQLMLKIDPAEEDEEEKLALDMRVYQVPVSPTDTTDGLVPLPTTTPIITPTMLLTLTLTPTKAQGRPPKKSRSSPSEQKSSASQKKKVTRSVSANLIVTKAATITRIVILISGVEYHDDLSYDYNISNHKDSFGFFVMF